ncbi:hypothetical protein DY000_02061245 [Brassica cretica]|uniref:Cupin type-1 domain-containing protein n=1 Tax=Brassica cretica TaxID=69181 RepID=A0ABQ7AT92_BRACR|nr:hypothetical protein DY000_02061245 [Brassica cretica]
MTSVEDEVADGLSDGYIVSIGLDMVAFGQFFHWGPRPLHMHRKTDDVIAYTGKDPSPPVFCLRGGEASSVPSSSALVSGGVKCSGGKGVGACDAFFWGLQFKVVDEISLRQSILSSF